MPAAFGFAVIAPDWLYRSVAALAVAGGPTAAIQITAATALITRLYISIPFMAGTFSVGAGSSGAHGCGRTEWTLLLQPASGRHGLVTGTLCQRRVSMLPGRPGSPPSLASRGRKPWGAKVNPGPHAAVSTP